MAKDDDEFVLTILGMFEKAYFRNLAFEALAEAHNIANWENLVDRTASDPRVQPQLRAKFQTLRQAIERGQPQSDPTSALQALLKLLPTSGKVQ